MMNKIGVDIDEVLSETVSTFLTFYNSKYNTDFKLDDIVDYSFKKLFHITAEDEKRAIQEFFNSDMARDIPTIEGSGKAIKKLSVEYELYAVSSRPTQLMSITKTWLNAHYPNCFKDIILTNSHFDTTKTKSDVCRNLGLNIFIDDQIIFAEDCAQVCQKIFLIDKPWNRGNVDNSNIFRVTSWEQITRMLAVIN